MALNDGMALAALLARAGLAWPSEDRRDARILSVTDDSRRVKQGSLFVAVRGTTADGHDYIQQAVAGGASAVVVQHPVRVPDGVAVIHTRDSRRAIARLSAAMTGLDEIQRRGGLRTIAVTGTNGKSTFCYLMRSVLQQAGHRPAMLGTVVYDLLDRRVPAPMTTPDPAQLAKYLVEAADAGADYAVLEASSHALDQRRLAGLKVTAGVFTNLSGDHLDYHHEMASYLRAKKRLFDQLGVKADAIVNTDDPAAEAMLADCHAKTWLYGLSDGARVRGVIQKAGLTGSVFDLKTPDGSTTVSMKLIGKHNVYNALAVAGAGLATGLTLDAIARGLEGVSVIPGRLQRVGSGDEPITVLVDYAHTDDALRNVLDSLGSLKKTRIITVFGCGGNRDRTKRPRMGSVAAELSDRIVVTSDNPRSENPDVIIDQILAGIGPEAMKHVTIEPDRRAAILQAVGMAEDDDIVLIAGKGHETYQDIAGRKLPFDDVEIASQALAERYANGRNR